MILFFIFSVSIYFIIFLPLIVLRVGVADQHEDKGQYEELKVLPTFLPFQVLYSSSQRHIVQNIHTKIPTISLFMFLSPP